MTSVSTFRPVVILAAVGLVAALILAGLDRITRDRITLEQDRRALAALTQVLPATSFNNELLGDWIDITIAGLERPARVYRARLDGQPTALVVDLTTSRGYSGDIRLLVAVATDATVIAVRVLEHRETPGLGDRIEERRSDWIRQFRNRRLGDPAPEQWAPDRRGGDFDTMTNATITASAVIDAVRLALEAVEAEGDGLWVQRPGSKLRENTQNL